MHRPLILLCPTTLLLLAATAAAQYRYGHGYPSYSYPSYSYPVYVEKPVYYKEVEYRDNYIPVATPVPFTVAVPVVSYLYNGGTFSPAYYGQASYQGANVEAYPFRSATAGTQQSGTASLQLSGAAGAQLSGTGGYQQGTAGYQQGVTSATAASGGELSDAVIDRLIERIEQRLQQRQRGATGGPPPPVRQSSVALSVLATHCASCHTGPSARKGFMIMTAAGVLNPNVDRDRIVEMVESGRMPLDNSGRPRPLAPEDVEVLRQWRDGR